MANPPNPWGAPTRAAGAWALEAEAEERELAASAAAAAAAPPASFPPLHIAATTKTKKKKPLTVPLGQFITAPAARTEVLVLPTGPRERSADDPDPRSLRWSGPRDDGPRRDRDDPPRRAPEFDGPSRADESLNWATEKKAFAPTEPRRIDSRDRYPGPSRADELTSWSAEKKSMYPSNLPARDNPDRWGGTGAPTGERKKLVLAPPKRETTQSETIGTRASIFGNARPREEVLREKGLDPVKVELDMEAKRPGSSSSSRPSSAHSSRPGSPATDGMQKPRVKVNPFGDAKPREVQLQEKGIDWRKLDLDLEHRGVNRADTEEEIVLKEDINHLKSLLKDIEPGSNTESAKVAGDLPTLKEQIDLKEAELEALRSKLDDELKFSQRSSSDSRPGSGAGRLGTPSDRPPSQSGRFERGTAEYMDRPRSRGSEYIDRPRSRGSVGDGWGGRSMDGRRGFQGGSERGLLGDRDMDRAKPRVGGW